jgi:adenylate kinase
VRLVLLGSPGAGKGTQARLLEKQYGLPQVSTGDILRKAVNDQSPLGKKASAYMEKGELVPDSLMLDLVEDRLAREDCRKGFLLDGFPRTTAQAEGLQTLLEKLGSALDAVLLIEVPREMIIERLAGRRTCKNCGSQYHVSFAPPARAGICDRCGGELHQRDDDREAMIAARLYVYETQTAPLIDYYQKQGLLREIDGADDTAKVRDRVIQALGLTPT